MHGVLLVDKSAGRSSHDVVDDVRRATGQRRVGHAGTLDPSATGLLIVCLGKATRVVEIMQGLPKRYEVRIVLGVRTTTDDAEGEIVHRRSIEGISRETIELKLEGFRGEIEQVPPDYSAVHVEGRRAYARARAGEEVALRARRVRIDSLEVLGYIPPHLTLSVECSSGTYIRALARDLGESLGCGGHVQALRRTRVGPFRVEEALAALEASEVSRRVQPIEDALAFLPEVRLLGEEVCRFVQGSEIAKGSPIGQVRVFGPKGFIGIGQGGDTLRPQKVLFGEDL